MIFCSYRSWPAVVLLEDVELFVFEEHVMNKSPDPIPAHMTQARLAVMAFACAEHRLAMPERLLRLYEALSQHPKQ